MDLKKSDIEGIANSRTTWRYKWHILGWVVMLITIGIVLSHIYDWQAVREFSFLGHTYHLLAGALWFFGLATLALVGCAMWSQRQKKEVKALTEQYQGQADLFYSTFYPERSDKRVKAVIHRLTTSREDKEVTITIIACLIAPAVIITLMLDDVASIGGSAKVITTLIGVFVIFGGAGLVATIQGKREIGILRQLGYIPERDGKDRKVPIMLTAITMAVGISMMILGIIWLNPFYIVGALGFELCAIAYLLFLIYIGPYYKSMKAIMEQEVDTEAGIPQ